MLDQLRTEIRSRHYSYRTEQAYVDWSRRYILFHGKRHPKDLGAPELGAFLSYLAVERGVRATVTHSKVPIVMTSATDKRQVEKYAAHYDAFHRKPYLWNDLLGSIKNLLPKPSPL